jgi:ribosomal protein L40E
MVVVKKPLKQSVIREQDLTVCLQCTKENPQGSKFCSYCGSKFQRACIQCGKTNPDNSSFCNQCGFALT